MKVLVTGASGFIGQALCQHLASQGHDVVAAVRKPSAMPHERVLLAGGTSSFVRFGIPAGRSATVTVSSNGALPPSTLKYALVRLR